MKALVVNKTKGQNVNIEDVIQQVRFWINDASSGVYTLSFEKVKRPRSNDQNKLMWVWFTCIARSWTEGYGQFWTPQNVHDYYCRMFLQITLPDGTTTIGSTRTLTSEQFTDFLNKVQVDAATEHNITLLSITDPMYDFWSRQYVNY